MFRAFGHERSSILDGGLPRWQAEGFPLEDKPPAQARKSEYPTPFLDKGMIRCKWLNVPYPPMSYELAASNSLRSDGIEFISGSSVRSGLGTRYRRPFSWSVSTLTVAHSCNVLFVPTDFWVLNQSRGQACRPVTFPILSPCRLPHSSRLILSPTPLYSIPPSCPSPSCGTSSLVTWVIMRKPLFKANERSPHLVGVV